MRIAKYFKFIPVFALGLLPAIALSSCSTQDNVSQNSYSFIAKFTVIDGQAEAFEQLMTEAFAELGECLNCKVLRDANDQNVIWISETWPDKDTHSLALKSDDIKAALAKGRPMIAEYERVATNYKSGDKS